MKRAIVATIVLITPLLPLSAKAAGDATQGKAYYAICQTCHGENGEGNLATNAPRLASQHAWYLVRQLKNFRAGIRGIQPKDTFGQQMAAMANTLPNDQAVADVVAYIGTLDAPAPARTETGGDLARGAEYYAFCMRCHGTKGQGFKDSEPLGDSIPGPRLAGQHDWYLTRQLKNFKTRLRGAHDDDKLGREMVAWAMTLHDDKTIRDVVAYIQTLK